MKKAEQLAVATPREDVNTALDQLTGRDVRQMLVIENGHLVGLLRRRDIVKWLQVRSGFTVGGNA